MKEKIKRFEAALTRRADVQLAKFWNELDHDINKQTAYIEHLELTNGYTFLDGMINQEEYKLLRSQQNNRLLIAELEGMFDGS